MNTENKTTPEDIAKLQDLANKNETAEEKFVKELPSNNGEEVADTNNAEECTSEEVDVTIDPVTGTYQQVAEDTGISKEMAAMLDIKPEDLLNIPESINDLEIPEEVLLKNITEGGIQDAELAAQLLSVIQEYRKVGVEFRKNINWFTKLPEQIKNIIDKQCMEVNNNAESTKKIFAEAFIQDIINDSGIDSIVIDMQKSMEEAFDTSGITEYILEESRTEFEKNMELTMERTKAVDMDEEEKAKLLERQEKVMEAFKDAYTYESFINAIKNGKVRVKPFDIRKYKRWVQSFYSKYEGDTPFIIKDPTTMAPTLHRFFPEYTTEQCVAFVIGFIKYTRNMSANDVVDHTYMSYFISNIAQLDLVTHKVSESDFINILSNNIKTALDAINNIKS